LLTTPYEEEEEEETYFGNNEKAMVEDSQIDSDSSLADLMTFNRLDSDNFSDHDIGNESKMHKISYNLL